MTESSPVTAGRDESRHTERGQWVSAPAAAATSAYNVYAFFHCHSQNASREQVTIRVYLFLIVDDVLETFLRELPLEHFFLNRSCRNKSGSTCSVRPQSTGNDGGSDFHKSHMCAGVFAPKSSHGGHAAKHPLSSTRQDKHEKLSALR